MTNVVLITVDSLRADHVGCCAEDDDRSLTPNLDAFARQGAVFTRAFAQGPFTSFSVPSLFTARYPCHLPPMKWAMHWGGGEHQAGRLVESVPTLPEMLRAAGYHTAAFHSNPLLSRLWGFQKGFDVFFDDVFLSDTTLPAKMKLWVARLQRIFRTDPCMNARNLHARVRAWVEEAPEPFFLWVHYMDVHGPYLSRKVLKYVSPGERLWRKSWVEPAAVTPDERETLRSRYRRQIAYLDAELGRFWELLDLRRLLDRTLLVITADHGDEFFEHGGYSHRHKLYDELLHVPLTVRLPGERPARLSELTELIQVVPSVLDAVGVMPPSADGFDAASFLPTLRRHAEPRKAFALSEVGVDPHDNLCIRTTAWKLIWKQSGKEKELYKFPEDLGEQSNVAAEHPEVVAQLERELLAHCRGPEGSPKGNGGKDAEEVQMSETEEQLVLDRLRDLGYI